MNKPSVTSNICRVILSDMVGAAGGYLVMAVYSLLEISSELAVKAREEREEWWKDGWTWVCGRLTRR